MISFGGVIVSCVAVNTTINLFYPICRFWEKICNKWKRIGRKSVFISRDSTYEIFKNISRNISPLVNNHKNSVIISFIERNEYSDQIIVTQVPCPNESIIKRIDKDFSLEIISLGDLNYVHGFEILYMEEKSSELKKFLTNLSITKKIN